MKLQLLISAIATTTIISSSLPANAQYFPTYEEVSKGGNNHCSDVNVGQNTFNDRTSVAMRNNGSTSSEFNRQQSSSSTNKKSGGGGLNFGYGGFKVGGSGQQTKNSTNQTNSELTSNRNRTWEQGLNIEADKTQSVAVVGKNCDSYFQGAARVQSTQIEAEVNRELIQSQEKVKIKEIESNSQQNLFNTLMQGW